jgi:hypothetical protein
MVAVAGVEAGTAAVAGADTVIVVAIGQLSRLASGLVIQLMATTVTRLTVTLMPLFILPLSMLIIQRNPPSRLQ